jgi:hypothetical protein
MITNCWAHELKKIPQDTMTLIAEGSADTGSRGCVEWNVSAIVCVKHRDSSLDAFARSKSHHTAHKPLTRVSLVTTRTDQNLGNDRDGGFSKSHRAKPDADRRRLFEPRMNVVSFKKTGVARSIEKVVDDHFSISDDEVDDTVLQQSGND